MNYIQLPSQEEYNNFILSIFPNTLKISLPTIMEFEGKPAKFTKILGICAHKEITLNVLDVFTRSIKFKLTWDDTKTEEVLIFCPTNKSPEEVLRELEHKITLKVANTYTDEELKDLEKQARAEVGKAIKKAIDKGDVKIEKL